MTKHPWLIRNYKHTAETLTDSKADKFYWGCFILAAFLFAVFGFVTNYFELMNKAVRGLAFPCGIMLGSIILLMGMWFNSSLPRRAKYVVGPVAVLIAVLATILMLDLLHSQ